MDNLNLALEPNDMDPVLQNPLTTDQVGSEQQEPSTTPKPGTVQEPAIETEVAPQEKSTTVTGSNYGLL